MRTKQLIPVMLQADRPRRVSRIPQNIDHLTVGAQSIAAGLPADLPDQRPHRLLKPLRAGPPIDHESGERLSGIAKKQTALTNCIRHIDAVLFELPSEGCFMIM